MAHHVRSAQASSQVAQSVAAVRSTGLRLLHFSNPECFGAISPAGISANNYEIVMISQDNFLIIFQRARVFLARLCFKGKTPDALQKCGIRV